MEPTVWRHKKTGGLYDILMEATLESDLTEMVVYQAHKDKSIWIRPRAEFFDGRFEKIRA